MSYSNTPLNNTSVERLFLTEDVVTTLSDRATTRSVESLGSENDAFRVLYSDGVGMLIDWAPPTITPVSSERTKYSPIILPRIVNMAGVFAMAGAVDLVSDSIDLNYAAVGAGTLVANTLLGYFDLRKTRDQRKAKQLAEARAFIKPKMAITSDMILRGLELDQALLIQSQPTHHIIDTVEIPESLDGSGDRISTKELTDLLYAGVVDFRGIHFEERPIAHGNCSCNECAWNNTQTVMVVDPAAVLFDILSNPVSTDQNDDTIQPLLDDMLYIAGAQKEVADSEMATQKLRSLTLGGSEAAEKMQQATIEEHESTIRTQQSDIGTKILDCVADYLTRKSETFRSGLYRELGELSRKVLERDVDETTVMVRIAFDEIALRAIHGLSYLDIPSRQQRYTLEDDMRELKLIANHS